MLAAKVYNLIARTRRIPAATRTLFLTLHRFGPFRGCGNPSVCLDFSGRQSGLSISNMVAGAISK